MVGGDGIYRKIVARFGVANVGGAGALTVTHTSLGAAYRASAAGIQCSGDAAAVVSIESPAGTFLWRKRFAAAFNHSEAFPPGTVIGPLGQDILVKVSAATANAEANMQGFDLLPGF